MPGGAAVCRSDVTQGDNRDIAVLNMIHACCSRETQATVKVVARVAP